MDKHLKDYTYSELLENFTQQAIVDIYGKNCQPYTILKSMLINFHTTMEEWKKITQAKPVGIAWPKGKK